MIFQNSSSSNIEKILKYRRTGLLGNNEKEDKHKHWLQITLAVEEVVEVLFDEIDDSL